MQPKWIRTIAPAGMAAAWLVMAPLAGCGTPRATLETGPVLTRTDLGLPEGLSEATSFTILEKGRSVGRFPTALAVAKLARAEGTEGSSSSHGWRPATLKEERAVYWNSLFNAVPAIREVIVIGERTPGPPGAGPPAVAATAGRLGARLCLVYGRAAAGPGETALIGALLDTHDGRPIARIQAQATPADFESRRPDVSDGDRRHIDPEYLAARKFERQVRLCIIELATRDSSVAAARVSPPQTAPSAMGR